MMFFGVVHAAAWDTRQEEILFSAEEDSITIMDKIQGYQNVDYQLLAKAGQSLAVTFKPTNSSSYFNILPPGSDDVSMFTGSISGDHFERMLPADGIYTLRVYLMRSAARRNESSDYELTVSTRGKALEPVPASADATLPGTLFHASASVTCTPPYVYDSKEQACEAFVIRRGFDGTATVEIRPANGLKRNVLFIAGKPVTSDSSTPMAFTRKDDFTIVTFDTDERYEIPDALIFGG
jgi:hypothetical protein